MQSELEDKYARKAHSMLRSWTHLFYVCFCVCGLQNPKTPNLSPMADDAITQGGTWGQGSPLYICRYNKDIHKEYKPSTP